MINCVLTFQFIMNIIFFFKYFLTTKKKKREKKKTGEKKNTRYGDKLLNGKIKHSWYILVLQLATTHQTRNLVSLIQAPFEA